MLTYDHGVLTKDCGVITIKIGNHRIYPSCETKIYDICIENYDEYILLYYKEQLYDFILYEINIENLKNPELYCKESFKIDFKKSFFKKDVKKIMYLDSGWNRLSTIKENLVTIYNKNLIIIR